MVYSFNRELPPSFRWGEFYITKSIKAKQKPLPTNRKWLEFNNRMY